MSVVRDRELVQPYATLRQNLARRDRSLREKVVTLEEAASFVSDGASVGIGGSTMSRTPMAICCWGRARPITSSRAGLRREFCGAFPR